jgi:ATPase family associated with various cellular activities (AAA)
MIDCKAFRKYELTYDAAFSGRSVDHSSSPSSPPKAKSSEETAGHKINTVQDEELVICAPTFYGFAFSYKLFVQIPVDNVSEIVWNNEAYDKLALPKKDKGLIKTIVETYSKSYWSDPNVVADIISAKGSGLISLLHGDPGTGKTATVLGIAEVQHRPLFSIKISDLGTEPALVERRLELYFSVAEMWDSIILIDEADIFLQTRSEYNIVSNAMVGVFLTILESHNSVVFLTTNRAFTLDPAVKSRLQFVFHYKRLEVQRRKVIWQQFLDSGRVEYDDSDLDHLGKIEFNGRNVYLEKRANICREIRNKFMVAQVLVNRRKQGLTIGHIRDVVGLDTVVWEDDGEKQTLWS